MLSLLSEGDIVAAVAAAVRAVSAVPVSVVAAAAVVVSGRLPTSPAGIYVVVPEPFGVPEQQGCFLVCTPEGKKVILSGQKALARGLGAG